MTMDRLEKIKLANEYLQKMKIGAKNVDEAKKLAVKLSKKLGLVGKGRKDPNKIWLLVCKQLSAGICIVCEELYPLEELEESVVYGKWRGYCPKCKDAKIQNLKELGGWISRLCAEKGFCIHPSVIPALVECAALEGVEITEDLIFKICDFVKSKSRDPIITERHIHLFFSENYRT